MTEQKTFEPKEGQGTLFVNGKKQNTNQPDYTGSIKVNGKIMRIAGWVKSPKTTGAETKSNFLSLQISEPQEKPDPHEPQTAKVIF